MNITRRSAIGLLAGTAAAQVAGTDIQPGPFQGTRESLAKYRVPEWFRDAKFGIWARWGPQSAPEYGDWYARRMYEEGSKINKYHVQRYGHPSKFGFKDVIPTWKAEKFDPEHLMGLYKKAGAKYFMSMGVHHDNFDLWKSRHTRWNSVNMGPKKDIVGLFRKAALSQGLKFGVSEHLWISYKWLSTSHRSDKSGPYAGGFDSSFTPIARRTYRISSRSANAAPTIAVHGTNHSGPLSPARAPTANIVRASSATRSIPQRRTASGAHRERCQSPINAGGMLTGRALRTATASHSSQFFGPEPTVRRGTTAAQQ